ncbi:DUF4199 domain-containing protein [Sphingomonas sp. R647]|uniref:DUF4199 domain-containing protein n=1 Tax=Sphingomonas sp. R647 TaxID=2875233 RepID=UPI001CD734D5|nr:DUF4199 domain-containing protein [Sphingomonas sp. R647]MCA1197481.1 DUF4199 domain-containing protein [Sphingomonas sp. R647]
MQRIILTYGVIAGFVVAIPLFLMGTLMVDNPPSGWVRMAIGYLIMLIAFTAIFVAVKRHRDENCGGVIRFLPALGMGLAIALIGSLFYVIAWEAVLATNGGDFIAQMSARMLEEQRAAGATPGELAALQAQMAQMHGLYANPLFRVLITLTEVLPIGLLVALVAALLLRNPRFMPARTAE